MYTLKVLGTRRNTIAYHQCESYSDVHELVDVYQALGYDLEALIVERREEKQAA